jgi:DNA-binding transcriptional ArsR family regulator
MAIQNEGRSPRRVQSVRTAMEIIGFLEDREGAGVTEIAGGLGLNKGTVHTQLATLREQGFVAKEEGEYHLGLRFLELGDPDRVVEGEQTHPRPELHVADVVRQVRDDRLVVEVAVVGRVVFGHEQAVEPAVAQELGLVDELLGDTVERPGPRELGAEGVADVHTAYATVGGVINLAGGSWVARRVFGRERLRRDRMGSDTYRIRSSLFPPPLVSPEPARERLCPSPLQSRPPW